MIEANYWVDSQAWSTSRGKSFALLWLSQNFDSLMNLLKEDESPGGDIKAGYHNISEA